MTNKFPSFLKSSNSQRGQSRKYHLSENWSQFLLYDPPPISLLSCNYLTFLKMIGSSSHIGLMALLFWEVLVFNAFLLVSAGSPNISTSTYTPTRRSVRNCPEITYNTQSQRQIWAYTDQWSCNFYPCLSRIIIYIVTIKSFVTWCKSYKNQ